MMLTSTAPYLDNLSHTTTQSGHRWPVARCSVSWHRGRLIPTVRCVLVHSDQYAARLGSPAGSAGASGPRQWGNGTSGWVARTKALAVALAGTHKAWSSQSMQTLQRVGSIIRSTSLDCIAALGKKGATPSDQQPQQPGGPEDNDQDEETLVRASLSRFLTAASDAEVTQAARMADLSDMAYNVMDVTSERLQQAHGMELVANSRSSAQPTTGLLQGQHPAQQRQLPQHGSLELQQQQPAAWPMPVALLQHGGAIPAPSTDFNTLPASPRTPFVMASYAEDDSVLLGHALEYQPVTASGFVSDPGSPRRPSAAAAAAAAAAGSGVAVATMAMPAAPAMGGIPPAYMQPAVIRQASADFGLQYEVQQDEQLSMDEAALLQQLKQQEAFVLLEMQASQQMMFLLQQSQQQHLQDAGAASAAAHDWQELQGLAAMASSTITAAASTAAAAALAGSSSSFELAAEQRSPRSSQDATAVALAGAPADWFCCDGPLSASDATPTRFFSIQGSITLEHWRINLTIDPCEFERGALGPIKVHRGMYEAALCMYDTLLPLVQQHLAAHPDGKIALTGHSLGGSLATLLMLLMVHRGDLPVANVATTYTFGSPAVFCEGANGASPTPGPCHSCSLPCEHRNTSNSSSATDGLLGKLGLAADAVVNVIMTRDIVPRAFVCDYTLVAGVLKSWLPSFKEHKGLAACKDHKALYNFIGVVEVLQPTTDCDFVLPDEGHDMLPPGAALYKLTEPQQQASTALAAAGPAAACSSSSPSRKGSFNSLSSLTNISSRSLSSALAELTSSFSLGGSRSSSSNGGAGGDHDDSGFGLGMVAVPVGDSASTAAAAAELDSPFTMALAEHPQSPAAAIAAAAAPAAAAAKASGARVMRKSPEGLTLGDAILTFMNSPHPLQTLGEMRAYGHNGSISRYHNPASYTKALQKLSKD